SRLLLDEREAFVRTEPAADLCSRPTVREHDVAREVVLAADQRRADAVGVHRHARLLKRADPVDREAAGGDDPDPLEAVAVERLSYLAHEALVDPPRA